MKTEVPTAFPWAHGDMTCTGMTLRDYFATKAMQGLLSAQTEEWNIYDHNHELADEAYRIADAMIAAREE
jgi:hypothetical protein